MVCHNCGAHMVDNAVFCGDCGARLVTAEDTGQQNAFETGEEKINEHKSKSDGIKANNKSSSDSKAAIAVISVIIIAAIIALVCIIREVTGFVGNYYDEADYAVTGMVDVTAETDVTGNFGENAPKNEEAANDALPQEEYNSQAEENEPFDTVYTKGDSYKFSYRSDFIGIRYSVPAGWRNATESEKNELTDSEGTTWELYSKSKTDGSSFVIGVEEVPLTIITADAYIDILDEDLEKTVAESGMDFKNAYKGGAYEVAGKEYQMYYYEAHQHNVYFSQYYLVRRIGRYMVVMIITCGAAGNETFDLIMNNIRKY